MRVRIRTVLLLYFAATVLTAQNGNDLFRQALVRQTGTGDFRGAIQIYDRIVREFSFNRPLVAKALVQLGLCYESLEQAKSREYFQRVVDNYRDQADMVAEAQRHLTANADVPLQIATQFTDDPFSFAISPNGRSVVFAVTAAGMGELWLCDLVTGKSSAITGAKLVRSSAAPSGGAAPFWSPDSRYIGFFSDQKLKRIAATGGTAQTLADAPAPAGGTWSRDGVIVFTPSVFGLQRVPADGSKPAAGFGTGRNSHPEFLPDGHHFLFYSLTQAGAIGQAAQVLSVGSLDDSEAKILSVQALSGILAAPDQLLYATGSRLFARRLDPQTLELTGTTSQTLERVALAPGSGTMAVATSTSGKLAYRASLPATERQFLWLDRQGQPTGNSFVSDPAAPCCARISPDGRTIAFGRNAGGGPPAGTLWTITDTAGAQAQTRTPGAQVSVWSSFGNVLVMGLWRPEKPFLNLALSPVLVRESDEGEQPDDWSRDGRFLLFEKIVGGDLLALPIQTLLLLQTSIPIPVAQTSAAERNGRFSPGGGWVAYQSNALGGRNEIFIQPFPGSPDARKRVSLNGGTSPVWRGDGRELFFLSPDFHLMAVAVAFLDDGGVSFGTPAPLFPSALPVGSEYDVSWEGQRFLINSPVPATMPPIIVLSNWNRGRP